MSEWSAESKKTLYAVLLTTFQAPFMGSALVLAVPAIGADLKAGAVELSWVMNAYILSTAAFLLPAGSLADAIGRRRLFWSGSLLMTLLSWAAVAAPSIEVLLLMRVLQGVASAMVFSTGMAILSDVFPAKERGKVFGYAAAVTYLGLSAGPVLGGFISGALGWRWLFVLPALLSLAAAAVVFHWRRVANQAGATGRRLDPVGTAVYLVGLPLALWGLSKIGTTSFAVPALVAGLVLLVVFVLVQLRTKHPLLALSDFAGNSIFIFSSIAAAIQYASTFGLGFLVSLQLQVGRQMSVSEAGWVMLAQPAVMAIFSPIAGSLSDRIQPRILASSGMALSTLGLLAFVWVDSGTPLWVTVAALGVVGMGFAFFSSPNSNSIMSSVLPRQYGTASAVLSTVRMVGQSFSMAVTTLLIGLFVGNASLEGVSSVELGRATQISFIVFSALCALGVAASMARGDLKRG